MGSDPFGRAADTLTAAFTRRLTAAGHTDPTRLALELVVIARGHGWRPVEALRPPAPETGSGNGRAEYAARRAALDSRPPCACGAAVTDHQLDAGRRTGCEATGCTRYAPIPAPTSGRSA
ncbi:hypothetical protein AB0395_33415 [Streptosporangium sp. NPDC051023]|uniref:hypothetical protein n=1 Tax=Streptosporangium sp. NPDC051023 TaxID=3155410 RepID=UPI00344B12A6